MLGQRGEHPAATSRSHSGTNSGTSRTTTHHVARQAPRRTPWQGRAHRVATNSSPGGIVLLIRRSRVRDPPGSSPQKFSGVHSYRARRLSVVHETLFLLSSLPLLAVVGPEPISYSSSTATKSPARWSLHSPVGAPGDARKARPAMPDIQSLFGSTFPLDEDRRVPQPLRDGSAAVHIGAWCVISMLAIMATRMLMSQ